MGASWIDWTSNGSTLLPLRRLPVRSAAPRDRTTFGLVSLAQLSLHGLRPDVGIWYIPTWVLPGVSVRATTIGFLTIDAKGRATFPAEVRRALGLDENTPIRIDRTEAGGYELVPSAIVPIDQLWYHSAEGRARIQRAEADFKLKFQQAFNAFALVGQALALK